MARGSTLFRPRSTAEGVAAFRAAGHLEPDESVRCPDDVAASFVGGLNVTELARHRGTRRIYLALAERRSPGPYAYEVARTKFLDDVLLSELEEGLDEVVVLGAGLDSRAYRFADRLRAAGTTVLEVDTPEMQADKRRLVKRALGHEPDHVVFVATDFEQEDLASTLARAGHDPLAATLFVWSGVSMYLDGSAVAGVLGHVASHRNPRTSIVFDYCFAEMIDGTREYRGAQKTRAAVARLGEPFRFGIPEGQIAPFLQLHGLRLVHDVDAADATARMLTRRDGSLLGLPPEFGGLVHARVRG